MKLAQHYNRVNLVTSLIVLGLTGVIYYAFIHFILSKQLDKDLLIEEDEIREYVQTYGKLPLPGDFRDQKVHYIIVPAGRPHERRFEDVEYRNDKEDEIEPGRSLETVIKVGDKFYEVTISKSKVESEDLIRVIFLITLLVTAVLLISLIVINRFVLGRLWKPFHSTLNEMKAFNLADMRELSPAQTHIDEFRELNTAAATMASRVKEDYKELKSFTDNASHEMMTPLAVINSKLDTLLQTESFSDKQGVVIEDIYIAVGRLSRLNQSLLLLARMENSLIDDFGEIELYSQLEQKIRQFQELIELNGLTVTFAGEVKSIRASKYLLDILLNNLIGNAIRHNHPGGTVMIGLNNGGLAITNTGSSQGLDPSIIFKRFSKADTSEGMGLGLALSRQIAVYHGYALEYRFQDEKHVFSISF
ncbi:sensor histidine kinase [Hufsiella ginkgonis]|uniref:histidine kinase n=1 Tax=Hufsiella ginkgonis TaxID=2695274 RepID=A0A7K1XSN5_9SPHI|nr:HAMP domain-containing sensor histidine kinase [Hufsiella ginkgonis]MXV14023.1 sensor histidine kinase [Hufsiella ginkgonis]